MIKDIFAIIGVVSLMTWMLFRSRSQRKIIPILGIFAAVLFIWLFSITGIVAYLNGGSIDFVIVIGIFLTGISTILISVKDLKNK